MAGRETGSEEDGTDLGSPPISDFGDVNSSKLQILLIAEYDYAIW
jgi:hypothetical protein